MKTAKTKNMINPMRNISLSSLFILMTYIVNGQIGGKSSYEFLNLPTSARMTGLAGYLISVADEDVSLALVNPASLNDKMHNRLTFAHNFHFADISNGTVSYGRKLEKFGINTHVGIQYINYGEFTRADELGVTSGSFGASETAITIGASKKIAERLTVGANFKNIFSSLENYNSYGIGTDLALNYSNDSARFCATLLVRNIGYEVTTYTGTRHGMPFDIQIGFSKRLKHLPFRFSIIGHNLHKANVRYDDPSQQEDVDVFGQAVETSEFAETVDNIFRHVIVNGEFLLGRNENLRIRIGYNHLRRRELSLPTFRSLAGFGLGFGVKISYFKLDYGIGYHHLAGATNHITISTDLGKFFKKV